MKLSIYSIQSTLFEGEAEKLIAYTPFGQITVLNHHLPMISSLIGPSVEIADKQGIKKSVPLAGGFLEVRPESEVVVLVD